VKSPTKAPSLVTASSKKSKCIQDQAPVTARGTPARKGGCIQDQRPVRPGVRDLTDRQQGELDLQDVPCAAPGS
jgi:hypothetical protein